MIEHEQNVREFFEKCKKENPDLLRQVNQKYPVITRDKRRTQRQREQTVGLLGLQPANLPVDIAFELGFESIYNKELEEEGI